MRPTSNHTPIIRPQITQITQIKGTEKDKTMRDERIAQDRNVSSETFCEISVFCGSRGSIIRPQITQITQINRNRLSLCSLPGMALGAFELGYVAEIHGVLERPAALVAVGAPEA